MSRLMPQLALRFNGQTDGYIPTGWTDNPQGVNTSIIDMNIYLAGQALAGAGLNLVHQVFIIYSLEIRLVD